MGGKLDMLLHDLVFERTVGQPQLADVLEQAEQAKKLDLVALELQEAGEDHHVNRDLQCSSMRRQVRVAHLGKQEKRVRVAYHAGGETFHRLLYRRCVQARTAARERR